MKLRYFASSLLVALVAINASGQSLVKADWRATDPQTVTLFNRAKYQQPGEGYGRSAFSFNFGLRSDVGYNRTRNNYELEYGNITINHDSDWFIVTMVTDDCSRIKDLGAMEWSDVVAVPFLPASPVPQRGFRGPGRNESFEESSNGQVTRVAAGHIYVVHSKDRETDFYTMFRVDKLVPSDQVTISWKNVPAPGQ